MRGGDERARFGFAFALFVGGVAVGDDTGPGLHVHDPVFDDRRAQNDAAVHIAVGAEIPNATGVAAAGLGFEFGDYFAGADFWSAADGARREACEQCVERILTRSEAADNV